MRRTLSSALVAAILLSVRVERPPPEWVRPPPTEIGHDAAAEKANKQRRKAWMKERHKAPPGVDWLAIERENGLRQIAKRNALAGRRDAAPSRWIERGSVNQAGRMHTARHSSDHARLYAGSALGGLWRANADGTGWTPLGDNLYGGVHWVGVFSGTPDVVLAATDWGYVHRTEDEGATWTRPEGLPSSIWSVRRMLVAGDAALLVLQTGNDQFGLYRSLDQGRSFAYLLDLRGFAGDLWAPRTASGPLYLLADSGVLVSDDLGGTWTALGPLPVAASGGELVGSEAGAPRLWAVVSSGGGDRLLRSDDGGVAWQDLGAIDDYWNALEASPYDADTFAWGGVELHVTHDGGGSFRVFNPWWDYYERPDDRLHADIMGIDAVLGPEGEELWYVSTDGGLYRSNDAMRTVHNLSLDGLRVSQYYGTLTSVANPERVAAGAQDQGYQATLDLAPQGELYAFDQLISGDYAHLTSSDGSHELVYSVYPGVILVQIGEDEPRLAWVDFPGDLGSAAWLPPVVADPRDPEAFFFCGDRLWRFERDGNRDRWVAERWSDEDFGASPDEYLSALAFSPVDPDRVYAATNYGRLFTSDDHGVTWEASEGTAPWGQYFYGTALIASWSDPDVAWVGGSGYESVPAVLRTTDGGRTWEAWDEGLPETLVYGLAEARDGGTLVAGTETAVYRRDEGGEWVDVTGADAPVTIYWSVEALPHEATFRFGTYGRGIWDYQLDPDGTERCWPAVDRDGDGVACDADCDDADGAVFPDAEDACGGIDADCDPATPTAEDCAIEVVDDRRCRCATGGGGFGWAAALGLLLVRRRRR